MASGVDFGILNTQVVPHPMQVIQTPNASLQDSQSALQGLTAGTDAAAKMQEMRIQRQLLPGQLAQQAATLANTQATTANTQVLTQGEKIKNLEAQRDLTFHQNADKAYVTVKNKGGTNDQAMDAYQSQLKPEDAALMQNTRDLHMKSVIDNNATAISNAAGIVAETQQELAQTNDPKQQQHLLDNANRQLDRIDPNHMPIKTVQNLHDYGIATLGTLMNPKVQAQLQYEVQKAQITAVANTTGKISEKVISEAVDEQKGAQQMIATQAAYDSTLKELDSWNMQHPNMQITTGPGTQGWMEIKKKIAAVGGPIGTLDKLEKLQAARDTLVSETLSNLKSIPRNEKVISSFTNALSNPTDTVEAQQVKSRLVTYGAQEKISYSDFLQEYRDHTTNGSVTGAQRQWVKFLENDPSIQAGGLPDPNYIKNSDEYLKYVDKNYSPPKTSIKNEQNPTTNQTGANTKVMDGVTYVNINGKWYTK